jgi:TolA-binding protein
VNEIVRSALTADDRLDDIKRAQIWARIDARLDEPAPRRRWWPAIALTSAAACAALAWLALRTRGTAEIAFVAPAETTLSTHLGPHTRAALVGPAHVELVGTPGDATAVRLRSGTLLAEFTGGPGRSLRVEAPGVVVEIVGTLFAVEARGDDTCVSVSHGRVRVTPVGESALAVSTGETWCRSHAIAPISPAMSDALGRHEAVITATAAAPPAPPIVEPLPLPAPAPSPIVEPLPPPAAPPPAAPPPAAAAPRVDRAAVIAPRSPAVQREPVAIAHEPERVAESPSPSPAPAEPAPAPAPPPVTADSLYTSAESALAHGNAPAADRSLAQLLASFPDSALADQALYERARIAYQRHAYSDARAHLAHLAQLTSSALAEPGAYLTCRIAVETHDAGAKPCLLAYRKAYPRSPHDLDVLGLLAELAYSAHQCTAAAPLVSELARRYPKSSLARAWTARCP